MAVEQNEQNQFLIEDPSQSVEDSGIFEVISLDTIDPNKLTVEDLANPQSVLGLEEIDASAILRQKVEEFFQSASLTPVERQVLEGRFGLLARGKTLRELGLEIGKSPSTIRRIQERARRKVVSTEAFAKMHSELQSSLQSFME